MLRKCTRILGLVAVFAAASGCTSMPTSTSVTYHDPVPYCAAVGTIDHPDNRYDGPASPEWIADAVTRSLHLGPAVTAQMALPVVWRCVDGSVAACSFGFGMPCDAKVGDTSHVPTKDVMDFCRAFPEVDRPLPGMSGPPSIYTWGCRAGWPHIIGLRNDLDAEGYPRRYWLRVTPGPAFSAQLDPTPYNASNCAGSGRPARRATCSSVAPT